MHTNSQVRLILFLLLASIALLWLPQMRTSLWLDETFTLWGTDAGLAETIDRAQRFHHSTLYFVLTWFVRQFGGSAEWVLRLPSVLCAAVATALLVRLGTHVADRETGLLAGLIFVTDPRLAFAATDARPYAGGVLAVLVATTALVKWRRTGQWQHGLTYVFAGAVATYFHPLFAVIFLVHVVFAWLNRSDQPRLSPALIGAMLLLLGVLELPVLRSTLSAGRQGALLSFAGTPTLDAFASIAIPPLLALAVLVGLTAAASLVTIKIRPTQTGAANTPAFVLGWALIPPLALFLVAVCTPYKVLVPRYTLPAVPGLALLVALGIRLIEPARGRRVVALAMASLAIADAPSWLHGAEDWRGALTTVARYTEGRHVPVLIRSGCVEGKNVDWLEDTERRALLLSPLSYYPIDGPSAAMPWDTTSPAAREYVERIAVERVIPARGAVLINRLFGDNGNLVSWFQGRLQPEGLCQRSLGNFGLVQVVAFEPCAGMGGSVANAGRG